MRFFRSVLELMGFTVGEIGEYPPAKTRLTVNINESNGMAFNIWEAHRHLAQQQFHAYAPGLHHIAFNAASKAQVDEMHQLVTSLGAQILDGPGEFPFAHHGYYAVYFLGPDQLKFEFVYMPELVEFYSRQSGEEGIQA